MRFRTLVCTFVIAWCFVSVATPAFALTSEPDAAGLFSETPDVITQGDSAPINEVKTMPSSVLNNRIAQPASTASNTSATAQSRGEISSTDAMVIIIAAVLLLGGAVVWMMTRHKKTA
ncbi:MAG: hypothetical protein HZC01_02210 [Candidatus Kerfeldbacteria bacterium]|nr:hypothetical protein [Candidatus Kerfeldbacteria bacterium]